jgi:hypothetical protein
MLLKAKDLHMLPSYFIAALLIELFSASPLPHALGIGPLGQVGLSVLFVIAFIIWLVVSGREQRIERKRRQESGQ